jgi:hypothetical protein
VQLTAAYSRCNVLWHNLIAAAAVTALAQPYPAVRVAVQRAAVRSVRSMLQQRQMFKWRRTGCNCAKCAVVCSIRHASPMQAFLTVQQLHACEHAHVACFGQRACAQPGPRSTYFQPCTCAIVPTWCLCKFCPAGAAYKTRSALMLKCCCRISTGEQQMLQQRRVWCAASCKQHVIAYFSAVASCGCSCKL